MGLTRLLKINSPRGFWAGGIGGIGIPGVLVEEEERGGEGTGGARVTGPSEVGRGRGVVDGRGEEGGEEEGETEGEGEAEWRAVVERKEVWDRREEAEVCREREERSSREEEFEGVGEDIERPEGVRERLGEAIELLREVFEGEDLKGFRRKEKRDLCRVLR